MVLETMRGPARVQVRIGLPHASPRAVVHQDVTYVLGSLEDFRRVRRCQDTMERAMDVPLGLHSTYDTREASITVKKGPLPPVLDEDDFLGPIRCLATCQEVGILHNGLRAWQEHLGVLGGGSNGQDAVLIYDFRLGNMDPAARPVHVADCLPPWCTPEFLASGVPEDQVLPLRWFVDTYMLALCMFRMVLDGEVTVAGTPGVKAAGEAIQALLRSAGPTTWTKWASAKVLFGSEIPAATVYVTRQACTETFGWAKVHTFRKVLLRAEAQAMVVKYTASETEDPYPYYPPPVLMGGVGEVHGVRPEPCRALCDSSPRGCSTWTIGGQAKREPLEVVLQPPAVLGPGRMPRDEWPAADFLPSALASVSLLLTAVAATPPRGFCTFPTFDSLYVVPGGVVLPYLTFCADDAYLLSADARAMEELPRECVVAHLADLPRDRQTRDAVLAGWTWPDGGAYASLYATAYPTDKRALAMDIVRGCGPALIATRDRGDLATYLQRVDVYMYGRLLWRLATCCPERFLDSSMASCLPAVKALAIAMCGMNPAKRPTLPEAAAALAAALAHLFAEEGSVGGSRDDDGVVME